MAGDAAAPANDDPRTVVIGHRASYADPIAFRAGDSVRLTGRVDFWDGHCWLWAVGPDGREGWVPDDLVAADRRARADYSAAELSCSPGERLAVLDARHGWLLCRAPDGQQGWVPARSFAPG